MNKKITLRELKYFLSKEQDLPLQWNDIEGNDDLVDNGSLDYFSFCDLMERIMLRYNRIIKPDNYSNLTNLSKIVHFINNTEPPKDEEGKNFLIRKRLLFYS